MLETVDNYVKIQGELLKKTDVATWDYEKFNEYFTFCDMFYVGGKVTVSRESVAAAEQYQDVSPFIYEMLARIDRPLSMAEWKVASFYMRLNTIMRIVKGTIQKFPELLSPLTVEKQRNKPQYGWMDQLYGLNGKVKPPEPEPEPEKPTTGLVVMQPMAPAERLADAMGKVADLYYAIAESVTDADIASLSAKDKINALNKLSYLHTNLKKGKLRINFNKINVAKGTKEELEEAMLAIDDDDGEE